MCYNKINHGQSVLPNPKERRIYPCRILLLPLPIQYVKKKYNLLIGDRTAEELKKTIGQKISLIPGKTEAALMVDISDNHTMYFAGEKRKLAYVDVRCYGSTEFENKKALTEALFDAVELHTGLHDDSIYLTYTEFSNWGTRGTMK